MFLKSGKLHNVMFCQRESCLMLFISCMLENGVWAGEGGGGDGGEGVGGASTKAGGQCKAAAVFFLIQKDSQ